MSDYLRGTVLQEDAFEADVSYCRCCGRLITHPLGLAVLISSSVNVAATIETPHPHARYGGLILQFTAVWMEEPGAQVP